ncbi:hypothetical protein BBD42_30005 [Paenibacillus sp. BIHB 4019]|uniref:Uncharacterized protein n=1 Tax=Paenibacillus sp. BIHB 4019 TaxID=1870819 RepID=A0A1B2DRB7_9BACL|nr:hypothetical protein BBD42_30005 [Paenibacillus sp. BIHB 4019]
MKRLGSSFGGVFQSEKYREGIAQCYTFLYFINAKKTPCQADYNPAKRSKNLKYRKPCSVEAFAALL